MTQGALASQYADLIISGEQTLDVSVSQIMRAMGA
jgi:hypothetical protein